MRKIQLKMYFWDYNLEPKTRTVRGGLQGGRNKNSWCHGATWDRGHRTGKYSIAN